MPFPSLLGVATIVRTTKLSTSLPHILRHMYALPVAMQLPDLWFSGNMERIFSAVVCLGVVGAVALVCLRKSKGGLPFPPSPPLSSLRGHTLPHHKSFLTVAEWIDDYGPVISIRSAFQKMVIIGRHKAAVDIMEKQSGSLADRPRMVAAGEILSGDLSIVFTPAGDRFRRMRSTLHTHLRPQAAESYQPMQMSVAKNTVLDILQDPYNFQNHVRTYAATAVTKMAYGNDTRTSATDTEIKEIRQFLETFRVAVRPGAYLVDSIPWLRYIPWYGQELKRGFKSTRRIFTDQLNRVKEQLQSGADIGPSFAKYMLENQDSGSLTDTEMAFLAGTFFAAGTDTTAMAICTVLMAAAHFPEEQAKVQDELDAVIGRHRAPTFADEKSLPRLSAFISEALRWRPLAPHGTPHRTTKEVIWENYRIPAGTTVFGHHWAISRDPEIYPEPDEFKPERWINDQGLPRDDLKFFVFGFGRRICPAQHVAARSVFINAVLILWSFQLKLDPTKPLHDMGFMSGIPMKEEPCTIDFNTRILETELVCIMQNYPEVA